MGDDATGRDISFDLGIKPGLYRFVGGNVEDRPGLRIIHGQSLPDSA